MRNLLFLHAETSKAKDPDSKFSMQQMLHSAMAQRFECVAEGVEFTASGQQLEIDILAVVGRTLLVVECKSAFHPCNVHELRTSYDHVIKAARQLDRLKRVLQNKQVAGAVMHKLGWKGVEYDSVVGCIVTANRMFNGYDMGGNPVRQAHELIHLILDGTMTAGTERLRVWQGEEFAPEDLIRYLDGATLHEDLFASMEPRDLKYQLGSAEMIISTFVLNGERAMQLLRSRYPRIGELEDGDSANRD